MTTAASTALAWVHPSPDRWVSADRAYVILRSELPGEHPNLAEVYTLRWREGGTLAAWGERWTGIHLSEHHSLDDAQFWAGLDAYDRKCRPANVAALDALPALGSAGFYWWISDGTSRARLIVVRNDDGALVARVVGMSRAGHEYEPVTVAEVDITALAPARPLPRWLALLLRRTGGTS